MGETTVRHAVELSQNIPFVEMLEEITPKTAIKYLKKMGISSLTDNDETLALALGGLEQGITPLEMAAAYAMIANDGVYIEPTFYTTITNKSGKTIVESDPETTRVVSKQVAYIVKEILTEPVTGSSGTATYCSISGIDVAAKTGTTNENYDRWLCGFTPYYTAVTWFGYDQNETIYFNKQNPAGIIWANVMKRIHSGLEDASFEMPSWIQTATICADSGGIANSGCTDTYEEYFLWGTKPDECTEHNGSKLTNSSSTSSSSNTNNNASDEDDEELVLDPSIEDDIPTQENETDTNNNTIIDNNTGSTGTSSNSSNENSSNTNNSSSSSNSEDTSVDTTDQTQDSNLGGNQNTDEETTETTETPESESTNPSEDEILDGT